MTDRHDPMTDPTFLAAIDGATIPGLCCHVHTASMAGTLLSWGPDDGAFAGDFFATPEWEDTEGIAVSIEREGACYTDTLPVEWTGDGVEDAHRYLAAMRRWQRTLPTLYARWEGDPSTDFVGSLLDLCREYDDTNIWESDDWYGGRGDDCRLLDIIGAGGAGFAVGLHNMAIRSTPFPPCEEDPVREVELRRVIAQYCTAVVQPDGTYNLDGADWDDTDVLEAARPV